MIRIVTDSTVNITRKRAAQLGLTVLPMGYTVNGQRYLESFTDCNGNFEALLQNKNFVTNQVSVESFVSAFSELVRRGDQVLCIVISSRLSGTYRSAFAAAAQINATYGGEEKVIVVDSLCTAGGMLLLCQQAIALAGQGMGLQELAQRVEEERKRISVVFSLDSMDALRRSGRIGIVRQSVSTILNLRPLLCCKDGAVVSLGSARGRNEQINALVRTIETAPERMIINGSSTSPALAQLQWELELHFAQVPLEHHGVGPVLGHHLGMGVLAVSWIDKE